MSQISVVVPVYKVEDYIYRCVDSILAQSFKSFDLILIDDGSPDNCGNICDEYAQHDERVIVIHQPNQGLAEARNVGIEWAIRNSDSEWITCIDSDDWIHQDYLKMLYEAATEHNVQLSICNCIKTSEFNVHQDIVFGETKEFTPEDFWCFRQYGGAWAKLYKKEHFHDIRYPKGLLYEDVFVTYKLLFMQQRIVYLETPLYYYYIREGSITQSKWTPRAMAQLNGLRQQLKFYRRNHFDRALSVTAKKYVYRIREHIVEVKKVKNEYRLLYFLLQVRYKIALLKNRKEFPFANSINMYRLGFPVVTALYKKWTYLREYKNAK